MPERDNPRVNGASRNIPTNDHPLTFNPSGTRSLQETNGPGSIADSIAERLKGMRGQINAEINGPGVNRGESRDPRIDIGVRTGRESRPGFPEVRPDFRSRGRDEEPRRPDGPTVSTDEGTIQVRGPGYSGGVNVVRREPGRRVFVRPDDVFGREGPDPTPQNPAGRDFPGPTDRSSDRSTRTVADGRSSAAVSLELKMEIPPSAAGSVAKVDSALASVQQNADGYGDKGILVLRRLVGIKAGIAAIHKTAENMDAAISDLRVLKDQKFEDWPDEYLDQARRLATVKCGAAGDASPEAVQKATLEELNKTREYFSSRLESLQRTRAIGLNYDAFNHLDLMASARDPSNMVIQTGSALDRVNEALAVLANGAADFVPDFTYETAGENFKGLNLGPEWEARIKARVDGTKIGDVTIGGDIDVSIRGDNDLVLIKNQRFLESGTVPGTSLAVLGEISGAAALLEQGTHSSASNLKSAAITVSDALAKLGRLRVDYLRVSNPGAWSEEDWHAAEQIAQSRANKLAKLNGGTAGTVTPELLQGVIDDQVKNAQKQLSILGAGLQSGGLIAQVQAKLDRTVEKLGPASFFHEEGVVAGDQSFLSTGALAEAADMLNDALKAIQEKGFGCVILKNGSSNSDQQNDPESGGGSSSVKVGDYGVRTNEEGGTSIETVPLKKNPRRRGF